MTVRHVVEPGNSPRSLPKTLEIVTGRPPVFVIVMVLGALTVPTCCAGNVTVPGPVNCPGGGGGGPIITGVEKLTQSSATYPLSTPAPVNSVTISTKTQTPLGGGRKTT